MSTEITTLMKQTYQTGIEMLAGQMECMLGSVVRREAEEGKRINFQQIGLVAARQKTERHQDTKYVNMPHRRRWVSMTDWSFADLMDFNDLLKIVQDPGGTYSQAMVGSINRAKDAAIITAALGTAYTGEDGTTAVTLPAAQQIAAGGTGFTYAKVESAMDLLAGANAFDPRNSANYLHIAWTRKQEKSFLQNAEVKSVDYNTQRVLLKGTMGDGEFYGFRYHRLEDWTDDETGTTYNILPKVSTTRTCVAWVQDGLLLNDPMPPRTLQDRMPGKDQSWQYWIGASFGTTRMQEKKVVQIDVVES